MAPIEDRKKAARNRVQRFIVALVAAAGLATVYAVVTATRARANATNGTAAAKVGNSVITSQDLEHALAAEFSNLEQRRRILMQRKLDQLIDERLLAQEAQRRGVTIQQLLQTEAAASAAVTEEEVDAFIAQRHVRLPEGDKGDVRERVRGYLGAQKTNDQNHRYIASLRAQSHVDVYLKPDRLAQVPMQGSNQRPASHQP